MALSKLAKGCIAAGVFTLAAVNASADTDADSKLYVAPEIVVTASRIEWPVTKTASFITIITKGDIQRAHAESVGELLRSVAGLNIVQSGSAGKAMSLFIRGANSNHCLVMLDGVPVNDPATGAFDFSGLDAAAIERIEIVRGPYAVLYGSSAIGGVVNIITSTKEEGTRRSVSLAGGSLKSAEGSVTIASGGASTSYSYTLSGITTDGQAANDFYKNVSFSGAVSSKITATSNISVNLRYCDGTVGLRGPQFDPDRNAEQGGGQFLVSAAYRQFVTANWSYSLRTSFLSREITWDDPRDPLESGPFAGNAFSETNSDVKNVMWQNDLRFSDGIWLISGAEWREEQTTSSGFSPFGTTSFDDRIGDVSFFANGTADFKNVPTVSAGVRLDDHSEFGAVSTYKFSLSYPLPRIGTAIKGSFGTGFRAPSLDELYYPGYGNPKLEPERTSGWDCGVRQDVPGGRASFELAYFRNSYRDMISYDFATYLAGNIGEARSDGVEFQSTLRPLEALTLQGSYAFTRTEDLSTGKQLLRRPRHSGAFSISYRRNAFDACTSATFVGRRLDNDFGGPLGEYFNSSYSILDLIFTYHVDGARELFCKIRNLTDERYDEVAGYPAPGARVMIGTKVDF